MHDIDQHQQFAAELGIWAQVVDLLPLDRLILLRHWLRQPAQVDLTVDRPVLEATRAGLLADVCDRLVNEFGESREYLASLGDAFPSAPDDLSGMPESKGQEEL